MAALKEHQHHLQQEHQERMRRAREVGCCCSSCKVSLVIRRCMHEIVMNKWLRGLHEVAGFHVMQLHSSTRNGQLRHAF